MSDSRCPVVPSPACCGKGKGAEMWSHIDHSALGGSAWLFRKHERRGLGGPWVDHQTNGSRHRQRTIPLLLKTPDSHLTRLLAMRLREFMTMMKRLRWSRQRRSRHRHAAVALQPRCAVLLLCCAVRDAISPFNNALFSPSHLTAHPRR